MIIRVHRHAEDLGGAVGDDLVHVHVGAGARTGLEHVDRELIGHFPGDDLLRGALDGDGHRLVDHTEHAVDGGTLGLDHRQGLDHLGGDSITRDGEVVNGALRLLAPSTRAGSGQRGCGSHHGRPPGANIATLAR